MEGPLVAKLVTGIVLVAIFVATVLITPVVWRRRAPDGRATPGGAAPPRPPAP